MAIHYQKIARGRGIPDQIRVVIPHEDKVFLGIRKNSQPREERPYDTSKLGNRQIKRPNRYL